MIFFSKKFLSTAKFLEQNFCLELRKLPYSKLLTLQSELESLIQAYNESLVQELAHKDELEYEKELKNTFISLLLSIQNRRRQFLMEKKRKSAAAKPTSSPVANGNAPQVRFCPVEFSFFFQFFFFFSLGREKGRKIVT